MCVRNENSTKTKLKSGHTSKTKVQQNGKSINNKNKNIYNKTTIKAAKKF